MKVHPDFGMHFLASLVFMFVAADAALPAAETPLPDGHSNQQQQPPRVHSTRHHSFILANGTVVHRMPPIASNSQLIDLANLSRMSATTATSSQPPNDELRNRSSVQKRQPLPAPSTYFADRTELSRNISFLLENLLERYEKSHLPTHGQGVPTVVKTNMVIRSMGPVSELDMDYSMDCYFRQHWRDTRLKFRGPMQTLSLSIKMLERIWRPDTYFYNGKQSHIHTITVPNKLLRLTQDGDILYSMRLTIKASCPMELRNFPMDRQSCPLILGSYAYTTKSLVYEWEGSDSVTFVQGMTLSQFDLISIPQRNFTYTRREGDFSVLQVSFNMQRLSGYFLIQVYVPCILIVVLSWVSFWIHREATSDRVGLGITTVLTLSTISLDSRTDLPKVRYATALDWFLQMSFFYCIATLLEFAGVHFFTKVGSGEIPATLGDYEDDEEMADGVQAKAGSGGGDGSGASNGGRRLATGGSSGGACSNGGGGVGCDQDDAGEWEDMADGEGLTTDDDDDEGGDDEETLGGGNSRATQVDGSAIDVVAMEPMSMSALGLKKCVGLSRDALLCPIYGDPVSMFRIHPNVDSATATASATATMSALSAQSSRMSTMERQTQTEVPRKDKWQQIWLCVLGDENFRRQRQREASEKCTGKARYINSVSLIDRTARVGFPMSFGILNILYWLVYVTFQEDFPVPGQ